MTSPSPRHRATDWRRRAAGERRVAQSGVPCLEALPGPANRRPPHAPAKTSRAAARWRFSSARPATSAASQCAPHTCTTSARTSRSVNRPVPVIGLRGTLYPATGRRGSRPCESCAALLRHLEEAKCPLHCPPQDPTKRHTETREQRLVLRLHAHTTEHLGEVPEKSRRSTLSWPETLMSRRRRSGRWLECLIPLGGDPPMLMSWSGCVDAVWRSSQER
jgi:hypothetical protein